MLQSTIESEVDDFVTQHADRCNEHGKRCAVRNGYFPSRELLFTAGPLEVKQPQVRDNSPAAVDRVVFSPTVPPLYPQRSTSVGELIRDFTSKASRLATSLTRFRRCWAKTLPI